MYLGKFDINFFNSGAACHINHRELAMVAPPLLGLHKLYDDAGHGVLRMIVKGYSCYQKSFLF